MKFKRQAKILELINDYNIETQDELAERLSNSGFPSTQATISRDIKQLKILKVLNSENRYKYATTAFEGDNKEYMTDAKFYNILKETVVNTDIAKNLILVKTYPGMAHAAGSAIDNINFSEVVGTIAGDDTVLLVFATDENANLILDKLRKIIFGKE